MSELPGPLIQALERGAEVGFFGGESFEAQVAHAREFASCTEAFLADDSLRRLSPDPASEGRTQPSRTRTPGNFLDLGSGGGLPGLVLAHLWSDSRAVLLDSNQRRTAALEDAVDACGWSDRVTVVRARAEVAARSEMRGSFDLVVARAFGSPPVTAECAAGFLRVGGLLVVSEPPPQSPTGRDQVSGEPVRWPVGPLAELGLLPVGAWRDRYGYQVLLQQQQCPDRFPRREGIPRKRPIYSV